MIKFKTKTEFPVPYKREIQQQIIRLIVNNYGTLGSDWEVDDEYN